MKSARTTLFTLILSLILLFSFTLPAFAETTSTFTLADAFKAMFSSAKVLGESDDYLIIAVDYDELNSGSSANNSIVPDNFPNDITSMSISYKVVILFGMQGDAPVVCAYIPMNEDGTFPKGGMIGEPGVTATALISPAFLFQNMTITPTAP